MMCSLREISMKNWFVIPARKGSKGLVFKNRKLLEHTLDIIPDSEYENTIVTSDDEKIIKAVQNTKIRSLFRDSSIAQDETPIKNVMADVIKKNNIKETDTITMLYLTYPQRRWSSIQDAISFFKENKSDSLLCSKSVDTHPFLCMYDLGDNKGKQIITHDLYRRQDYPKCFEISHFICIFKVNELNNLNKNMYNDNTIFFPIDYVVDVDTQKDFDKVVKKND